MADEPKQEPLLDVPPAPRELSEAESISALDAAMQRVSRRLAPIPLRDRDGTIRAYACPRCFRVSMSTSCGGPDGRAEEAKHSREAALKCGVCQGCAKTVPCDTFARLCPDCRAAENKRSDEYRAAHPPEPEAPRPARSISDYVAILKALDEDEVGREVIEAVAAVLAELTA